MNKTLGQIAYEAYCAQTGWKSLVSGAQLPPWEEVKPEIQIAWQASAQQVWWRGNIGGPSSLSELRDRIAMSAMQGYMMGNILHDQPYQWGPNIATLAYTMADYMMAERAQVTKPADEKEFQTLQTCRDHWKTSFDHERENVIRLRKLVQQLHAIGTPDCKCRDCNLAAAPA